MRRIWIWLSKKWSSFCPWKFAVSTSSACFLLSTIEYARTFWKCLNTWDTPWQAFTPWPFLVRLGSRAWPWGGPEDVLDLCGHREVTQTLDLCQLIGALGSDKFLPNSQLFRVSHFPGSSQELGLLHRFGQGPVQVKRLRWGAIISSRKGRQDFILICVKEMGF